MSELTRGQSIMKVLFVTNIRGGYSFRSYATNNLTLTIELITQVRTVLNSAMYVVS